MALELDNEIDQQNDPAEERDRMLFRLLTSSRSKSPLPTLSGAPDAPPPGAPPSSGAGSFLGRPVSPRIPAARTIPAEPPTFGTPPIVPSPDGTPSLLGGGPVRPAPPRTAYERYQSLLGQEPQRADFDKYKLSTGKQILGGALAALAGATSRDPRVTEDLATRIFQRPELKYEQAEREYGQQLGRAKTAADVEREQVEEQHKQQIPVKPESLTQIEADLFSSEVAKGKDPMQTLGDIYAAREKGKAPQKANDFEQFYAQYIRDNKLPDSSVSRLKARKDWERSGQQEPGNFLPTYDSKTGQLTGAWDPKSGRTVNAPAGGGTTSQGLSEADKRRQALDKQIQPYQAVIDESNQAQQLKDAADKGNAEADVGLALTFFKAMRSGTTGGSGIRFTQQENNLIMGARSLWDAMEVRGNKIFASGQPLSKTQRQQILDVINIYRDAAQRRVNELGGSNQQSAAGTGQTSGGQANRPPLSSFEH